MTKKYTALTRRNTARIVLNSRDTPIAGSPIYIVAELPSSDTTVLKNDK